jgi:uncharacterized membrane protein YfcA
MMETMAYFAAILIGISLGVIGGGGSILTVPVLVYLFGISPIVSTSYSLFIVGSTSLIGAYTHYRQGLVRTKTALIFGVTSITTVYFTRKLLVPLIPPVLFQKGDMVISESMVTMVLFAILMVVASSKMIWSNDKTPGCFECNLKASYARLFASSIGIGLTTGLLGAGGGFLLIPVLVLFLGLPMREAIGTSLLIISLNSLTGFLGDWGHFAIDWPFLIKVTSIAVVGVVIGNLINKRIKANNLKKGFGWFVLVMGIGIICHEVQSWVSL